METSARHPLEAMISKNVKIKVLPQSQLKPHLWHVSPRCFETDTAAL